MSEPESFMEGLWREVLEAFTSAKGIAAVIGLLLVLLAIHLIEQYMHKHHPPLGH
jgi:uncharacterized membrane protein